MLWVFWNVLGVHGSQVRGSGEEVSFCPLGVVCFNKLGAKSTRIAGGVPVGCDSGSGSRLLWLEVNCNYPAHWCVLRLKAQLLRPCGKKVVS